MRKIFILSAFVRLFPSLVFAASAASIELLQQEKLELIYRIQDTRTVHGEKLIAFLTDIDPAVRERALLAYGSIQDTAIVDLLVERYVHDADLNVKSMAAFAIGQTGIYLSEPNRIKLQHDLIWNCIERVPGLSDDKSRPSDRLIEEIGKFGTKEALSDLILRFGNTNPPVYSEALVMSIARFAVRGIQKQEAVQYLLQFVKPNDVRWQVIYALQRIGSNPEIFASLDLIVRLDRHKDPILRMNLAALLGKVKDAKICLEPLCRLAESDDDWRVRVNALRSLSNYTLAGKNDALNVFGKSFFSDNTNIAMAAIYAFGNTGLKKDRAQKTLNDLLTRLEEIAVNNDNGFLWQLQGEAAIAVSKLEGKSAVSMIHPEKYAQPALQERLLRALGFAGPEASDLLIRWLKNEKASLHRAALEALHQLCGKTPGDSLLTRKTYEACITALGDHDLSVAAAAASILGDSVFLGNSSVGALLESLSIRKIPDDVEAIQEIIVTLGKLKDGRAVNSLENQLLQNDNSVRSAAVTALKSITGNDYSSMIQQYGEPIFTDFDFKYLRLLPDTVIVKMETLRGNVVLELYKKIAPFTVMSFLKLAAQRGYYRGLTFHRVVPNFVVQGGDPRGDGWGGPGYSIRSEFSPLTYQTGMLGMASSGKDTEGSQFFITHSPQPHLDGRYTLFGRVVSGMDVVNKIQLEDHILDFKIIQQR